MINLSVHLRKVDKNIKVNSRNTEGIFKNQKSMTRSVTSRD